MPTFRNEELLLKVRSDVDRKIWDENRYDAFFDELCGSREYQKDAIRTSLRYLLSGEYKSLRELAKENYEGNPTLQERYGSWPGMERHLQLPEQLSASIDLATGTGKSYVLYGIAAVLLAENAVDQVLVLCPSTTIETGLTEKFTALAGNANLRDLMPADAAISTPHIISARQSITRGCICIENYHAVLEHVGSSIQDSLWMKGYRTAVLNDETHHVANESAKETKKWKDFLLDKAYGFRYIIGVSGTCYIKDSYFTDVIYRYSLRQAMEEQFVKRVDYVAEMPQTNEPDDKWQLIHNRHLANKQKLSGRDILALSIIVTDTIARCKDVAEELKHFLIDREKIDKDTANQKVLIVYNNAPDLYRLGTVDNPTSPVEWIVSVSMLNEGWDVKRVFLIVPHEERAFNSKLLIAQVLGRGLRVPDNWVGAQPEVIVFNHDSWTARIRHLVNEILEIQKRIAVGVIEDSGFHFILNSVDYTLETKSVKKEMTGGYKFFEKGYIDLPADLAVEDVSVEFERAATDEHYEWKTKLTHKTYSTREIALHLFRRLEEEQDPDDPNVEMRTFYTDNYPVEKLEEVVKKSLELRKMAVATDKARQVFLRSLGTLRRKSSENVRYTLSANAFKEISTKDRQDDSVGAVELRRDKTLFVTAETMATIQEDQLEFFREVIEPGSGYKCVNVNNRYDFKTPLNAVIAESEPERKFVLGLTDSENAKFIHAWLKSTATRFYDIDFAWKKGAHPKRGKFSPDFFIKTGNLVSVVEIKGDEELREPSLENYKKNEFASAHFTRVNEFLAESGSELRYAFNFLTPKNYGVYFQYLRDGNLAGYKSDLDIKLGEDNL